MKQTIAERYYRRLGIPMAAGEIIPFPKITADPRPLFEAMRIGCLSVRYKNSIYTNLKNRAHFLELGWHDPHILYLIVPYEFGGGWGRILENLHYLRIYSTISSARRTMDESRTY